ncbi:hypothetical protein ILUMI_23222 [Ignelater luminosus]|uniref:DDE Tnp4 domain-containing protein n=1 Tax=Ignelater luminosus TaxID=2038154 RepID=A0A8K0CCE9_IGNLU|nr:hypothetical protein ILUMI_23222 [Ignelater luminosus]
MEELLDLAILGEIEGDDLDDLLLVNLREPQIVRQNTRAKRYDKLDLNLLTDQDFQLYFRFNRHHLPRLNKVPQQNRSDNRHVIADGTAFSICRPSIEQQKYFSGHKLTLDGIICSLIKSYNGRRHDAGIFRKSGLYRQLEQLCRFPNRRFVLYGDPAYSTRVSLVAPFRNVNITSEQQDFNTRSRIMIQ